MKMFSGTFITCLITAAIACIQASSALRILGIFPVQSNSHFNMCKRLMTGLAERGHQVDVYNHFPSKKHIPNYTDYSLSGTSFALQNNMTYDFFRSISGSTGISNIVDMFKSLCDLMDLPVFQKLIKNPPNDPPYDLVIVEVFVVDCYLAWGRHLNIPMVGVLTVPWFDWLSVAMGNPVNLATQRSTVSNFNLPMSFFERVGNFLLTNYVEFTYYYKAREQDEAVRKLFGSDYPSVTDLQKDLSLLLINYHQALNGIRAFTPSVLPVGGIHIIDTNDQLSEEIQKFLDESKHGFIYFSFGSMVRIETFPRPVLNAFYETFEKIKPVRVLMKIAKPEELPKGLPSNVITHHWLPQVKVLKHKNIKAFVTHGGLMSTQESIYFGVPLIGFPLFGDQNFNIQSYVKKSQAISLDYNDITEPIFTKAILEIIQNPIYKESAAKVSKLFQDNPMSPMDTAAYWIEYIARHGKDALRSPLADMPWWQSSLLDVYTFLVFSVLLTLYIIKVLVKLLLTLICRRKYLHSELKVKKS